MQRVLLDGVEQLHLACCLTWLIRPSQASSISRTLGGFPLMTMEQAKDHARELARITGARREEMAGLRWADVDFRWGWLTLADKVEAIRVISLTPYLA